MRFPFASTVRRTGALGLALCLTLGGVMLTACGSSNQADSGADAATQEVADTGETDADAAGQAAEPEELGTWVISSETVETEVSYLDENGEQQTDTLKEVTEYTLDEHGNRASLHSTTTDSYGSNEEDYTTEFDEDGLSLKDSSTQTFTSADGVAEDPYSYTGTSVWEKDDQGQPVKCTVTYDDGTEMVYSYEYAAEGYLNKRTRTETSTYQNEDGSESEVTSHAEMTYDELGFPLTASLEQEAADEADAGMNTKLTATYEYERDAEGRATKATAVDHNEAGEETSTTTVTITYDDNGNVSEMVTDVTTADGSYSSHEVRKFTRTLVEEPSLWVSLSNSLLIKQ